MTKQEICLYSLIFKLSDRGKRLVNEYLRAFKEYQDGLEPRLACRDGTRPGTGGADGRGGTGNGGLFQEDEG